VGGNSALVEFFKSHGVSGPIAKKYATPAAEMYRDIIVARRDGAPEPTDIAPYVEAAGALEAEAQAAAARVATVPPTRIEGGGGGGGGGGGPSTNGGGGGGQRTKYASLSGGPQVVGPGGSGDGGGGGEDDFFNIDFAAG
jgi:hypothetical protein